MNQSVAGAETTSGGARSEGKEQAQGHRPRVRRSTWLYGLAILIALSIVSFNIIRPIVVLPRIAPSPGFALVDSAGQPVTSEDRRGFLTLYSFSYLDCDVQCPQSVDDIAALREAVAAKLPAGTPLSFVTISLDPERDTPARLAAAGPTKRTGVSPRRISPVSGCTTPAMILIRVDLPAPFSPRRA